MGETKCATCDHSRWVVPEVNCAKCIAFNKWKPMTEPREPAKPIYIGHRE